MQLRNGELPRNHRSEIIVGLSRFVVKKFITGNLCDFLISEIRINRSGVIRQNYKRTT